MGDTAPHLMICTCEKTMQLDARAIGRACSARITQANQLCGLEIDRFKAALADGVPITVACTQEAPLFREVAEDLAPSSSAHLRQHSRNRGMVEGRGRGWPKGRSADCGGRRGYAAHRAGDAREPRRRPDLWPRRGSDRGRSPTRRPSRHHGASDQAWRRDSSPHKRVSSPEGQRAQCSWVSRPV